MLSCRRHIATTRAHRNRAFRAGAGQDLPGVLPHDSTCDEHVLTESHRRETATVGRPPWRSKRKSARHREIYGV